MPDCDPRLPLALSCVDGVGYMVETSSIHAVGTASAITYVADAATGQSAHAHRLPITGSPATNQVLVVNSAEDGLAWRDDGSGGLYVSGEGASGTSGPFIIAAQFDLPTGITDDADLRWNKTKEVLELRKPVITLGPNFGDPDLDVNCIAFHGVTSPPETVFFGGANVSGFSGLTASSTTADTITLSSLTVGDVKFVGGMAFDTDALEAIEDAAGGLVATGGTKTFITVTYQDGTGDMDFTVPVKDEDAMGSDSATHLATQQSIKAYVDGQTHAAALTREEVYDYAGAVVATGGTKTGITVTFQDGTDDMDFELSTTPLFTAAGATEGVSGAIVSGTTVKGVNGSFSGDVSAASGTNDGSLATMDMFGRMFTHTAYRTASIGANNKTIFYLNTNDQDANFPIPAGMTLKILAAYCRCKTGSTAGTTTWTGLIRAWDDEAHSGYTDHNLAAATTTSTSTYISFYAHGTMESPLASIAGDDTPVGAMGFFHEHNDSGASANDKHTISVYGVFIDD